MRCIGRSKNDFRFFPWKFKSKLDVSLSRETEKNNFYFNTNADALDELRLLATQISIALWLFRGLSIYVIEFTHNINCQASMVSNVRWRQRTIDYYARRRPRCVSLYIYCFANMLITTLIPNVFVSTLFRSPHIHTTTLASQHMQITRLRCPLADNTVSGRFWNNDNNNNNRGD